MVVSCYKASVTCKHSLKPNNNIEKLLQIIIYNGQHEASTLTDVATDCTRHALPYTGQNISIKS